MNSAQTLELKTILVGQIARAAAVFCVDEIIIFDDGKEAKKKQVNDPWDDPSGFLNYVLSFLECPGHLRKRLFPLHPNLQHAGTLPPLDLPHHVKAAEWCQYREGVTVGPMSNGSRNDDEEPRKKFKASSPGESSLTLVDAGFAAAVDADIPPHTRVTIKFPDEDAPSNFPFKFRQGEITESTPPQIWGSAVDPAAPREEDGYYWGYSTRRASSLSKLFTECPFEEGYDISIGTSERGTDLADVLDKDAANPLPRSVTHVLIVFGGVSGLEVAANADRELVDKGIGGSNVSDLFDYYVNICPGQGSRTIRTEEAVMIALGQLRSWIRSSLQ
jgi:predicted SPOUT superfamily RNA methylase MTH1